MMKFVLLVAAMVIVPSLANSIAADIRPIYTNEEETNIGNRPIYTNEEEQIITDHRPIYDNIEDSIVGEHKPIYDNIEDSIVGEHRPIYENVEDPVSDSSCDICFAHIQALIAALQAA
ncbi:uncharacterized protein [Euwallacea fornicatus]|uniref:uncharacterized protein isoform X2 n=1 Tax=Euwallacea fornicatus TaxID=995702 RepID=UPI00338DF4FC